jgi:hypothetical protein
MESWKHLLVRVEKDPYNQVVLVPSVPGLDSRFTQSAHDPNVVELLDELSRRGWELVAVQGREFWLRQRVE